MNRIKDVSEAFDWKDVKQKGKDFIETVGPYGEKALDYTKKGAKEYVDTVKRTVPEAGRVIADKAKELMGKTTDEEEEPQLDYGDIKKGKFKELKKIQDYFFKYNQTVPVTFIDNNGVGSTKMAKMNVSVEEEHEGYVFNITISTTFTVVKVILYETGYKILKAKNVALNAATIGRLEDAVEDTKSILKNSPVDNQLNTTLFRDFKLGDRIKIER